MDEPPPPRGHVHDPLDPPKTYPKTLETFSGPAFGRANTLTHPSEEFTAPTPWGSPSASLIPTPPPELLAHQAHTHPLRLKLAPLVSADLAWLGRVMANMGPNVAPGHV